MFLIEKILIKSSQETVGSVKFAVAINTSFLKLSSQVESRSSSTEDEREPIEENITEPDSVSI